MRVVAKSTDPTVDRAKAHKQFTAADRPFRRRLDTTAGQVSFMNGAALYVRSGLERI